MSDGKENQPEAIADVQPELRNQEIAVYCLGLGYASGINVDKLDNLAGDTFGEFRHTANHEEFRKFFVEVLGSAFDQSQPYDPIQELERGGTDVNTVCIAPLESRAVITAYWEAFPRYH